MRTFCTKVKWENTPHTYITVECLVSVDKGVETEGGRESHVVLQELENKEGDAGWTDLVANEKTTHVDRYYKCSVRMVFGCWFSVRRWSERQPSALFLINKFQYFDF